MASMHPSTTGFGQLALVLGLAAVCARGVRADGPAAGKPADQFDVESGEIVISASRTRQEAGDAASSVSVLSLAALDDAQVVELRSALAREPGVEVLNTGANGSQSSLFIRGASSHQTLLFTDGVRMNDRAAAYVNFLGGADLGGVGRLEVLRGPQSTLYGSSAMGGVVLMDTAPVGDTTATGRVVAGGGSFGTWGAALEARGGVGALGYSASASYGETANDRPFNDFEVWNYSGRLEFAPASSPVRVGATLRRQDGSYEEPGSRLYDYPGMIDSTNTLTTAFTEWRPSDGFVSRLTLALHERDYRYTSVPNLFGASTTSNHREILDWQNTWSVSEQVELTGGINYERSRYRVGSDVTRDDVSAGYISGIYRPTDTITVTGGVRLDDFDSFGSATTWRTGASWNVAAATRLHATVGTGFSAPGSDDRFGVPQWGQFGNPNLDPERAVGWDAGIDQGLAGGTVTLSTTYFENEYKDLFEWQYVDFVTYEGMIVNRARARTRGMESAAVVRISAAIKARLSYTYLDARNESDHVRLGRRPRHAADAELTTRPARAWLVGAGVHIVADRVEDYVGAVEDYATVRLFASLRAADNLLLKVRVENALNESYEEIYGYPARGAGVFGAVEWSF